MKLFEQFDAPNYVIRVAHIALALAPPDDSNIVSMSCSEGVHGQIKYLVCFTTHVTKKQNKSTNIYITEKVVRKP